MHRTETHHTSSSPLSQTKKLPKYQEVKERGDIGRVEEREGWWQSVLAPPIHPPDTSNEIIITRPPPPRHHWGSSPPFQRNYSRRGFATNTLCSRVRALCVCGSIVRWLGVTKHQLIVLSWAHCPPQMQHTSASYLMQRSSN